MVALVHCEQLSVASCFAGRVALREDSLSVPRGHP